MKKALQPKFKKFQPGQSKQNNMSMPLVPEASTGVPMVQDPGQMLAHDDVPPAGFAPH